MVHADNGQTGWMQVGEERAACLSMRTGAQRYRAKLVREVALVVGILPGLFSPAPVRSGTFELVGVHPDATNQPTATGRTLSALASFNGKVYAGFGNYTSNDGPIGIRAFNPDTGAFSARLLNSPTEAVYLFRELGGRLYAPDIDPIAGESTGGYAVGTSNGAAETWQHKSPVTTIHMYDVASHGGSLWMAGAQGNNATVWRSTDNGTNWSISLSVPRASTNASDYARFYGVAVYSNAIYVQGYDYYGKSHPSSWVCDGTNWSSGPRLTPSGGFMSNPNTVAGHLVYQSYECGIGASKMYRFNGVSAAYMDTNTFFDYKVVGDRLYGLIPEYVLIPGNAAPTLTDVVVKCTTDLTNWEITAYAPLTARSLAIVNKTLFVGAMSAQLWRYSDPVGPRPTVGIQATDPNASEEGPDTGMMVIRRQGDTNQSLTVEFAITGTASNGVDYSGLQDGHITFPPGSNECHVMVSPIPDDQAESPETVILTIQTNTSYVVDQPSSAEVCIQDLGTRTTTNGTPFTWLQRYGLDTNLYEKMDWTDTDHDGMFAWAEYCAGTDPTNAASVFRLAGTAPNTAGSIALRWPTVSNRFYSLSRSTRLLGGSDAFVGVPGASNLPASPPENVYTDTVDGVGPYFYRIDVRE